jgi:LAO/AO transport system kinase
MKKKEKKSALNEIKGIPEPSRLNKTLANKIVKKKLPDADELVTEILAGNTIYLSKAITLIESTNPTHFSLGQTIVKKCLPHAEKSIRIGVTGVPGVGKSTFIERLGLYYTSHGHKVAVLAIDPSSSLSKGSILGDKTRMENLSKDSAAYIRPSASGNQLGGVARKTRETIILCEAAGFDRIIIETVGVGQSETMVHSMVDFFLLLKLAGAGDELQGIKRGIIEMADLILINKAEDDNLHQAELAQKAFESALRFYPPKPSGWKPEVMLVSALQNKGITKVAETIKRYTDITTDNGYFKNNRKKQNEYWLHETIMQVLKERFYNNLKIKELLPEIIKKISKNELTAFEAADFLLNLSIK